MSTGLLALANAVDRIRAGGLVAFPTETVWGLGADATSAEALARLLDWKGRDSRKPVSVLVEDLAAAEALGLAPTPTARALARAFWPGPLTLVVPVGRARLAPGIASADGSVGLRCSPDPTAAALAHALGRAGLGPFTATSLNREGEPPARDLDEALALCRIHPGAECIAPVDAERVEPVAAERVACGSRVSSATPSTVVDCTGPGLRVIREGAIPAEVLAAAALRSTEAPRGAEIPR